MTETLIQVKNLSIDYPCARVINNISFCLRQERLSIVGESGAGKSMTAKALMGLVRKPGKVSAQTFEFRNTPLLSLQEKQWASLRGNDIAMIMQDARYALNPVKILYLQAEEALLRHQRLSKSERRDRVYHMARAVGLTESALFRYPRQLSGGMGQRAMIAIALINNPSVLIADEPTSALDARLRNQILELIIRQCEERRMGLLLISHDLPLVATYCHRVMVMYKGEQVDELLATQLSQATHPYTQTLWKCRPDAQTYGKYLPILDREVLQTLLAKESPHVGR